MKSFKELHESTKKGEEFYKFSLLKAKEIATTEKEFTKLAAGFTGKSKTGLKTCLEFTKILEEFVDKKVK